MSHVCVNCRDTHRVTSGDETGNRFMCTYCPTPCQACAVSAVGAYCAKTPCGCHCHVWDSQGRWNDAHKVTL